MIALAFGIVVLSGCSALIPTAGASPSASATRTRSPSPAPAAAPADLTFDAGESLDGGDWQIGWVDVFQSDPGFTVTAPDEGKGSYSYADAETQCQLFYQGAVGDIDMSRDDRTISDDFLATVLTGTVAGATREDVTAHAFDDQVLQHPGPGTADTRTIWGQSSDGRTWLHSARMFGARGGGVYIGITCPSGQDASAELQKVMQDDVRLAVAPAGGG
ncbi:hypothetical protein AAIB33_06945 [Microbacterium sp. AZCO]|uniref:hypothetical protein n=1 Tax=Microbacterium sp. AZCO TaxID=3142976 RepID=UPI0031F33F4E